MTSASDYFQTIGTQQAPFAFRAHEQAGVAQLLERLALPPGARILEPGCGHGSLTPLLAAAVGPAGRILAFDPAPAMAAQCRQATAAFPHVQVETACTHRITAAEAAWDCVLCFRLYPHLHDPAAFLEKARRWLAPGGSLVIANLQDSATLNHMHAACHAAVATHHMPPLHTLQDFLQARNWHITAAEESPTLFYLRAHPA